MAKKSDEIFGWNEKLRLKISPGNYGQHFKKHKNRPLEVAFKKLDNICTWQRHRAFRRTI
jgi:hypothetical protein